MRLGNAGKNFKVGCVESAVARLLGVLKIVPGTLNVEIAEEYANLDDGSFNVCLSPSQYNGKEFVKIKRCKVNGYPSAIIRPEDHFHVLKFKRRIEVMSSVQLRETQPV